MNRDKEEEIVRINLISRLLLMEADICRMIAAGTDAVLGYKRPGRGLDDEDIAALHNAKTKIDELLVKLKEKAIDPTTLLVSEICTCPIHIERLQAAGIRKLYLLVESDILRIQYLLTEAERSGAKRLYHLHALLHSSVRTP
jgi:hypothetical protein